AAGTTRTEAHLSFGNVLGNVDGMQVTAVNPETGKLFRFDVTTTQTAIGNGEYALQLNSVFEIVDGSQVLLAGQSGDALWNAMFGEQRITIDVTSDPASGASKIQLTADHANLRGRFDGLDVTLDSAAVRASATAEGLLLENITAAKVSIRGPDGQALSLDVAEIQNQILSAGRIDTADLTGSVLLLRPADATGHVSASLVLDVGGLPVSVDLDRLSELQVLAAGGRDQGILSIGNPSRHGGGKATLQLGSLRMVGDQVGFWVQHRRLNPHVVLSSDESGTMSMLQTEGERVFPGVRIDTARGQMHVGYVGDPSSKVSGHLVATLKMPYGAKDVTTYMLRGEDALGRADLGFALKAGVGVRRGERTYELGAFAALDGSSSVDVNYLGERTSLEHDGKSYGLGTGLRLPTFASTGVRYGTSAAARRDEVVLGVGGDVVEVARAADKGTAAVGFARYELTRKTYDGTRGLALGVLRGNEGSAVHVGWRRTWVTPRQAVPTELVAKATRRAMGEMPATQATAHPMAVSAQDRALTAQRTVVQLLADTRLSAGHRLTQMLAASAPTPVDVESQAVVAATVLAEQAARRAALGADESVPLDWSLVKRARGVLRTLLAGEQRGVAARALGRIGMLEQAYEALDTRETKAASSRLAIEDCQAMLRGQSDGAVWAGLGSRLINAGRKETEQLLAALGKTGLSSRQLSLALSQLDLETLSQLLERADKAPAGTDPWRILDHGDVRTAAIAFAREPRTRWQALIEESGPEALSALHYDIADRLHELKYEGRVGVRLTPEAAAATSDGAGARQTLAALAALTEHLAQQRARGAAAPAAIVLDPGKTPAWHEASAAEATPTYEQVIASLPLWRAQLARAGITLEGVPSREWLVRTPEMRRGLVSLVDFLLERPEMVNAHGISAVRIDTHTRVHGYALRPKTDAEPTNASLLEIDRYTVREGYGRRASSDAEERGIAEHEVSKVVKAIWTQEVSSFKVGVTADGRATDANLGYSHDGFFVGLRHSRDEGTGAFIGVSGSTPVDAQTDLKGEVSFAPGMAKSNPSTATASAYVGVDRRFGSTRSGSSVAFLGFGFRSIADVGRLGTLVGARGRYEGELAATQYFVGNGFASAQLELGPDELPVGLVTRYDTVNQAYLGGRLGKAKAMASVTGLAFQWGEGNTFIASLLPPFFVIEPAAPEYREYGYLGPLTRLGTSEARNANEVAVNAMFYGVLAQERGLQPDQQELETWIEKYGLRVELEELAARRRAAGTPAQAEAVQREINAWFEDLTATLMIDSYIEMASKAGKMAPPKRDEARHKTALDAAVASWRAQHAGEAPDAATRGRLDKLVGFHLRRARNLEVFAAHFFQGRKAQMDALILWARTEMVLARGASYPPWQAVNASLAPLTMPELSRSALTQRLRTQHEGLRKAREPIDALHKQVAHVRALLSTTAPPEVTKVLDELDAQTAALDADMQQIVARAGGLGPRVAKDDLGTVEKDRAAIVADTRRLVEGVTLGDSRIEKLCAELVRVADDEATQPLLEALRTLQRSPQILSLLPLHPGRLDEAQGRGKATPPVKR
ncbi:MAG: hypothetical protein AAB426_13335, partial [Myxococcota bacterium]